jgi:CRP-like cAMP-binding protein
LDGEDLGRALDAYQQLEAKDAANPEWPRQLANLYRRTGRSDLELDALVRCADRHAARREFLPALATYKMILSTDPGHVVAQQRLSELQPNDAVSVNYADDDVYARPAPEAPSARFPLAMPRESAPLDELVLTDIVVGAHPAHMADDTLDGVHEIPLDVLADMSRDPGPADLETEPAPAQAAGLERSPLFSSLDRQSLAKLVQQVRLVELEAGAVLFRQGDPAGALYLVVQGAVVPIAEGEPRTRLAVLEPGEFFGEIALFTNQPRNATIEALVDSQLLAIDRAVMWRLVQEHAQVLSVLLHFLRERLIHRLVRTSPLFQIFSTTKRSAIARRFRFLEVSDGHAVIEQHHPADGLFILLSGRMDVVHREEEPAEGGEKVLATLGPGDLFGEMSLLWREPSLASVEARGKCWVLALPAQSFREMLDHHPELAELAARIADERRRKNKRTLRDALRHRDGKAGII